VLSEVKGKFSESGATDSLGYPFVGDNIWNEIRIEVCIIPPGTFPSMTVSTVDPLAFLKWLFSDGPGQICQRYF
jgi:hypothetical protein